MTTLISAFVPRQLARTLTVGTHNGVFQPDEVLAVAMLLQLDGQLTLIRSRDPLTLAQSDILVDVGHGEYDHHQPGGNGARKNGVPYASAGLVWRSFGLQIVERLVSQTYAYNVADKVVALVDSRIVEPVDKWDCGARGEEENTLARVVSAMNPFSIIGESMDNDSGFIRAVSYMEGALVAITRQAAAEIIGDAVVNKAEKPTPALLVLSEFVPGLADGGLNRFPQHALVQLIVYEDRVQNCWKIQVRRGKTLLPEAWLDTSRRNNELMFVHGGRFIASTKSKASAVALAMSALAEV